jgi:hypothetical protein
MWKDCVRFGFLNLSWVKDSTFAFSIEIYEANNPNPYTVQIINDDADPNLPLAKQILSLLAAAGQNRWPNSAVFQFQVNGRQVVAVR